MTEDGGQGADYDEIRALGLVESDKAAGRLDGLLYSQQPCESRMPPESAAALQPVVPVEGEVAVIMPEGSVAEQHRVEPEEKVAEKQVDADTIQEVQDATSNVRMEVETERVRQLDKDDEEEMVQQEASEPAVVFHPQNIKPRPPKPSASRAKPKPTGAKVAVTSISKPHSRRTKEAVPVEIPEAAQAAFDFEDPAEKKSQRSRSANPRKPRARKRLSDAKPVLVRPPVVVPSKHHVASADPVFSGMVGKSPKYGKRAAELQEATAWDGVWRTIVGDKSFSPPPEEEEAKALPQPKETIEFNANDPFAGLTFEPPVQLSLEPSKPSEEDENEPDEKEMDIVRAPEVFDEEEQEQEDQPAPLPPPKRKRDQSKGIPKSKRDILRAAPMDVVEASLDVYQVYVEPEPIKEDVVEALKSVKKAEIERKTRRRKKYEDIYWVEEAEAKKAVLEDLPEEEENATNIGLRRSKRTPKRVKPQTEEISAPKSRRKKLKEPEESSIDEIIQASADEAQVSKRSRKKKLPIDSDDEMILSTAKRKLKTSETKRKQRRRQPVEEAQEEAEEEAPTTSKRRRAKKRDVDPNVEETSHSKHQRETREMSELSNNRTRSDNEYENDNDTSKHEITSRLGAREARHYLAAIIAEEEKKTSTSREEEPPMEDLEDVGELAIYGTRTDRREEADVRRRQRKHEEEEVGRRQNIVSLESLVKQEINKEVSNNENRRGLSVERDHGREERRPDRSVETETRKNRHDSGWHESSVQDFSAGQRRSVSPHHQELELSQHSEKNTKLQKYALERQLARQERASGHPRRTPSHQRDVRPQDPRSSDERRRYVNNGETSAHDRSHPSTEPAADPKQFFHGFYFLVTGFKGEANAVVESLRRVIIEGGGRVVEDMTDPALTSLFARAEVSRDPPSWEQPLLAVVADEFRTTVKYLVALCLGLFPLKISWVEKCVKQQRLVAPKLDDVMLGFSQLDGHELLPSEGALQRSRGIFPVSADLRVLFGWKVILSGKKGFVKAWRPLIIAAAGHLTDDLTQVDVVVCENIEQVARLHSSLPAVPVTWLIESLLNGRRISLDHFRT